MDQKIIVDTANIDLLAIGMEALINRRPGVVGIGIFHGFPGLGKSEAAHQVSLRYRAYLISLESSTTRRSMLEDICREMGVAPKRTIPETVAVVSAQLAASGRPLIIDEFDYALPLDSRPAEMGDKNTILGIVRDIHDKSGNSPIIGIGMEYLVTKLQRWEQFSRRVLRWMQAQKVSIDDASRLAQALVKVPVGADLVERIVAESKGSIGRVVNDLDLVQATVLTEGWDSVDARIWGARPLNASAPPARRI